MFMPNSLLRRRIEKRMAKRRRIVVRRTRRIRMARLKGSTVKVVKIFPASRVGHWPP